MMDKIVALMELLELDPKNAFARYALALEYIGKDEAERGLSEFDTLIEHNPDYVPAYQMAAQTLVKMGRTDEALARLHDGISVASKVGNQHALAEMEGLREELHPS